MCRRKPSLPEETRRVLAHSLARFQLGETGEGRIAQQVRNAPSPLMTAEYADCVRMLVAEEGRHARLLGDMVRSLGGETLKDHWTDRLFVAGRRAMGTRTKLLVLFVSEIVGIAYYSTMAKHFPDPDYRNVFREIASDEALHYDFHIAFFRKTAAMEGKGKVTQGALVAVTTIAGTLMVWDHRHAIRAVGATPWEVWGRLRRLLHQALEGIRAPTGAEVDAVPARTAISA